MAETFGKTLRRMRKEQGLTQARLADMCDTTKYTISAWELGKQEPNIETLINLASIFEVSVDFLIGNK